MKIEVICKPNNLSKKLDIQPITYKKAIENAFRRIKQDTITSSWKDAMASGIMNSELSGFVEVPEHGCLKDERKHMVSNVDETIKKIWAIGGDTGWYRANWLWEIRGFMDKMIGGVGLRRGRRDQHELSTGDPLDFWRVIIADKPKKRLLLYAEMKLPGEAWLEFFIDNNSVLHQTATFRPRGLWGRIYWFFASPFHSIIFKGMIKNLSD